jgi:TFIIF-interacting CTD phosphatase-like protein
MFTVVIFTASVDSYADAVLEKIDPDNSLISKRYYRDDCY